MRVITWRTLLAVGLTALGMVWGGRALAQAPRTRAVAPPAAAAPGTAPGSPAAAPGPPVAAEPFRLSPAEQQALDQVLAAWEQRARKIRTFKCELLRWEDNDVFKTKEFTTGELRYKNPDQALYRVKPPNTEEWTEYWVCDGEAIFEFNQEQKELVVRRLPVEMQGKAIEDGPLPFLFSTSAAKLKARYHLRLTVVPPNHEGEIWLEAFPKLRQDAANFVRAELILDRQSMLPSAVRVHLPNGQDRTVHQFKNIKINDPLGFIKGDFAAPKAPRGWQRREEDLQPIAQEGPPAVDPHAPRQAASGARPPVR